MHFVSIDWNGQKGDLIEVRKRICIFQRALLLCLLASKPEGDVVQTSTAYSPSEPVEPVLSFEGCSAQVCNVLSCFYQVHSHLV